MEQVDYCFFEKNANSYFYEILEHFFFDKNPNFNYKDKEFLKIKIDPCGLITFIYLDDIKYYYIFKHIGYYINKKYDDLELKYNKTRELLMSYMQENELLKSELINKENV